MTFLTLFSCLVALTALPSLNAHKTLLGRRYHLRHRQLPGEWVSLGCYTDDGPGRTLTGGTTVDRVGNSVESCIAYCTDAGFAYAGLEYGVECFCGNAITNGGAPAPAVDCSFNCPGNVEEKCGAGSRLNLYYDRTGGGVPPPPPPPSLPPGTWTALGCYTDDASARTLTGRVIVDEFGNSVETCAAYCQAGRFVYAGLEYGMECWCGNAISNGGVPAPASECSRTCPGNPAQNCGAGSRLNLYHYDTSGGNTPPPSSPPPPSPCTKFKCPSVDEAEHTLLNHSNSASQLFCRYQTIPNDFFCKYYQSTGKLKQDHDEGNCPAAATPAC